VGRAVYAEEESRLRSQLHDTLGRLKRVREGLTAAQAELADLMRTRQQRREALRRKQLAVSLLQLYVKQVSARAPEY
jgi:hypothetical protein